MTGTAVKNLQECFNLDPGTLVSDENNFVFLHTLYKKYRDDLIPLCGRLALHRKQLCENGYSCDFSDRESELLYLLVREFRPGTVVEISPCHGYSTNYILAALTDNGHGKLFSYEIVEEVYGKPTEEVIRGNLLPGLDQSRLKIFIGDVTKADVPEHDFLFLDSCHEAWFAGWYFEKLAAQPRICFVHDIAIYSPAFHTLLPKAPFMGLRESYHVLETLFLNRQRCVSVADYDHRMDKALKESLSDRYPKAAERSVIFLGHPQNREARSLNRHQQYIAELYHRTIRGGSQRDT